MLKAGGLCPLSRNLSSTRDPPSSRLQQIKVATCDFETALLADELADVMLDKVD
jgi:hypothetical protein